MMNTLRILVHLRACVRALERIAAAQETIANAAASSVRQPRRPAATEFAMLDLPAAEKQWQLDQEADFDKVPE